HGVLRDGVAAPDAAWVVPARGQGGRAVRAFERGGIPRRCPHRPRGRSGGGGGPSPAPPACGRVPGGGTGARRLGAAPVDRVRDRTRSWAPSYPFRPALCHATTDAGPRRATLRRGPTDTLRAASPSAVGRAAFRARR